MRRAGHTASSPTFEIVRFRGAFSHERKPSLGAVVLFLLLLIFLFLVSLAEIAEHQHEKEKD